MLSPDRWQQISPYLDQALALPDEERAVWLTSFRESDPELFALLQTLLNQREQLAGEHFLETSAFVLPGTGSTGQRIGAYTLVSHIGHGGMGSVWLAERSDGRFERRVAVKFLAFALSQSGGERRFRREGKILARLAHPHIAELLDAGVTSSGQPFLVIEHVDGEHLDRYCDQHTLSVRSRILLFRDVLAAVAHAHNNLIVHRDIKPSNVLVRNDGQVKLLDFGISGLLEGEVETSGTESSSAENGQAPSALRTTLAEGALTPGYASPEQITGQQINTASDVYSLGILLFELLTGEHPYLGERHFIERLEKIVIPEAIIRPSEAVRDPQKAALRATSIPKLSATMKGDLDAIITKALSKQPDLRYSTAEALSQDIDRYLEGWPVLARADRVGYRWEKFVWRNRLAIAAVMFVVVALTAGLAIATWNARRAREQAHVAESVLAFMEGIFRANSLSQPDPAKARQTTARDLLDIGASHLDTALNDVPAAKLRVLSTLSDMYDDLDLWDKDIELGKKRVALARSIYGRYDPAVADALLDLAESTANQDLHTEHGQILQEIGLILDRKRDYTSERRAKLEATLADFYNDVDFGLALTHTRTAVRLMRALPVTYERFNILQSSSYYELEAGEFGKSEAVSAEAIAIGKNLPDNQANLGWVYKHLAEAQDGAEDLASAEQNFISAREYTRKYNNRDGPWALGVTLAYANFLVKTSRIGQGLAILGPGFEASLKLARQRIALILLPDAASDYISALIDYGRIEAGLDIWKQVETMRAPLEAWNAVRMRYARADALIEIGRYVEAESLLAGAETELRRMNRMHTVSYNRNLLLRAHLLNETGRNEEALTTLSEILIFPVPPGRLSRINLERLIVSSEISFSSGNLGLARSFAAEARAEIASSPNRSALATWEARAALAEGRAMVRGGDARGALPLLERSVALRTDLLHPTSPALADAEIALSNCYLDLRRTQQAIALMEEARAIHRRHTMLGAHYRKPLSELERRLHYFGE